MKYLTAAWEKAMNDAIAADVSQIDNPEWGLPVERYWARVREIEHVLPKDLQWMVHHQSLHDGKLLAVSLDGTTATILVAIDRGYDKQDRPVVQIAELRYLGIDSIICRVAENQGDSKPWHPCEQWPRQALWIHDEVDVLDGVTGLFFHGIVVSNLQSGLMEIEVVFKDFVMHSAPLLSLPRTGTAVWKSRE